MRFPDFNAIVNSEDEKQYFIKGHSEVKYNISELQDILKANPNNLIMWCIPKEYIVVKLPDIAALPSILVDSEAKVIAYYNKTESSYYVIAKNSIQQAKASKTIIGIQAQYLNKVAVLPFKLKSATLPELLDITTVYDKGIEELPDILYPATGKYSWVNPIMDDPTDVLTLILRNLPRWTIDKKRVILNILNKYFCSEPRTSEELKVILAKASETTVEDFFCGNEFRHDALGEYLIKLLHIKKDSSTGDLYYYDANRQIYDNNPEYLCGYITKNYSILKDYQRTEVIKFINFNLYEDSVAMNDNPYSIVFNNGILDVRDLTLKEMTPDYHEAIKIEYNYSRYPYSETVDKFFKDISCNDKEIEQLLFESIGYALLKTSELQTSFTLVGNGRNGKSTFLDLLKKIVGKKYYTAISYKDLAGNFRASDLIGKLISAAGDISSQPLTDTDLYKSIVGGEDIMLERKFKDSRALNLFATLFYSCNKLSRTPDTTDGFYRRQTIIPCDANLSEVSKIEGMRFKEALLTTEAVEYTIYKAVQAIHNVFKRGDFTKSARAEQIKQEYIKDNSPILSWIKDEFHSKADIEKMTLKNAWVKYRSWCEDTGRKGILNITNFKNELKNKGIELRDK